MLVLTRKLEEAVAVGGTSGFEHRLKITVLGFGRGTVKLGFEVDASVPVHRWEVWQKLHDGDAIESPMQTLEASIAM